MKDNKKTITKKLLAFTLAFILLMTSLPLNVFAEMGNESNSNFIEENAGEVKNPVGIGKNSKDEKAKESPYQAAKNPDNIVGNEIPDGTINYGSFGKTKIFKVSGNMIRNAGNRGSSAPQWVKDLIKPGGTLDSDLVNAGSVKAYKPVVEEDPNIANKWTVKMLVAARDSVKTSKIVLVIDTSGSMNDDNRIEGAKDAANAFVDNVLDGSQSTQIGIVRFAANVSIVSDFTNNKDELHSKINALSAKGGTFTQAGVKQARTMLAKSGADKKYMVVLSDGVPTFNYQISDPNNYLIDGGPGSHTYEKQTGTNVPENEFLYNESATGAGSSMWEEYESVYKGGFLFPIYEYHYYNSGNCAIAESGFAKAANMRVFTVGLQTDATGSGVLRDMASAPGDFTEVTDVNQLTPVFKQIAAQILKTVNQATVNVNFNTGFQLPDDFNPATAEHSPGSEITIVDGKPKWTMATVATVFDEDDPSLKYEYITYTVTINDDILKNNSPENGINPLGQISMTYTDRNGNPQTTDFPETKVTPKLFVLNKVVTNNAGGAAVDSDKREFQFKVEKVNGSGYTYHETISLRPGERKIIHNPNKNAAYRVYELSTAKVYDENNENPLNFNVTTYYNKFEVTANGDLSTTTGDAPASDGIGKSITGSISDGTAGEKLNVTFKNWEEEEARAKISVHKIVEQSRGMSRQTPPTFTINLKRKKGVVPGMEKQHDWDQPVGMNQTVTIPHMMRFTTYIVTEKDLASISPYAPKVGEQGKEVEITLYKVIAGGGKGQIIDFTNVYNSSATVNVTATKTWKNGPDKDHTAPVFELYADGKKVDGVTPTIAPSSGTANSFTYTWTVQAINATTHLPIEYTVKEADVGANNKITVNNHIYKVSQHGNAITNTYEIPNNGTFTATKVWSGDEKVTRPTMNFELLRRVGNAEGEQVPGAEVIEIDGSKTTATWTGLETTNAAGDEYTFYVEESLKNPGDVNNDNWKLGKFDDKAKSITNTVKTANDGLGKLTIKKVLKNEAEANQMKALRTASEPMKFRFEVTGPYNYKTTFELAAGEAKELTNLYYGEYTVKETKTHGFDSSYSPENGKATLKAGEAEKTIIVTNTNTGGTPTDPTNVTIKVNKVWEGGTKPATEIELWRKGQNADGTAIDEKVNKFTTTEGQNSSQEFKAKEDGIPLAKYDPSGREFEYYAKELNVPANYESKVEGLTVTNTYIPSPILEEYLAIFNGNGGKPVTQKKTAKDGEVIAGVEEPTREGYKFVKWVKLGTNVEFDSTKPFSKDILDPGDNSVIFTVVWEKEEVNPADQYTVSFDNKGHGTKPDPQTVEAGKTATEPAALTAEGFDFGGWYIDKNFKDKYDFATPVNSSITLYAKWTETVTPQPPTPPTPGPTPTPDPRPWTPTPNPWWPIYFDSTKTEVKPAPKHLERHDAYIYGYSDGTVRPEGKITRAEVAAIFARLTENSAPANYSPKFPDVLAYDWFCDSVMKLSKKDIIKGYPDGTFKPNKSITRAEFAVIASKYIKDPKAADETFSDVPMNHWAKDAIVKVKAEGLISGYPDGTFKPDAPITRAEAVSIVNRMFDRVADGEFVREHRFEIKSFKDLVENHWAYYKIFEATNGHDFVRDSNKIDEEWKDVTNKSFVYDK